MNNQEKLRFKREDGSDYPAWEIFKLGDVAKINAAGDLDKEKFSEVETDECKYSVYSNALTDNGFYGYYKEYQYNENCITITARGDIGKAFERESKFYPIGRLITLHKLKVNAKVLTEAINKQINFFVESTGVPQLTAISVKNYEVCIPTDKEEQERIGKFFSALDTKLQMQVDKLELLKQYKKGLLQEIFSQQKRFRRDSGENYSDWEIFKLGDVAKINAAGDLDKEKFSEVQTNEHKYSVYSNALTNNGLYGYYSEYQYNENCVTITARGDIGKAFERVGKFFPIGRLITLHKLKVNAKLLTEAINKQINFFIESTGVPQLTAVSVKEYNIFIPTDKEEQEKIAEILSDVDQKIALQEEKLESVRQYKKAMLQRMF